MNRFVEDCKLLVAFILCDVILTVLAPIVTGFSFVAMNSLSVKIVTALVSVVVTATVFSVREKYFIKEKDHA